MTEQQTFTTALTAVDSSPQETLGVLRRDPSTNKEYKYVKFLNTTATVAAGAGSLVGYVALTGILNNVVCADMSDADAVPICAGATTATITGTLAVAYYVWVQINGPCTLDTAVTSGAAGKEFNLSTTDKTGTVAADDFSHLAGISYNTTTGVYLTCPR